MDYTTTILSVLTTLSGAVIGLAVKEPFLFRRLSKVIWNCGFALMAVFFVAQMSGLFFQTELDGLINELAAANSIEPATATQIVSSFRKFFNPIYLASLCSMAFTFGVMPLSGYLMKIALEAKKDGEAAKK